MPRTTDDENMAPTIEILSTGQRRCYDTAGAVVPCEGSRQDGAVRAGLSWPVPRFELVEGRVRDRLTRLEWSRDANPAEWPMSLPEARRFVAGLNADRYLERDDWRLPSRAELRSLTSFADKNPALPKQHPFEGVVLSWYWTKTRTARLPDYAWYVHMEGARTFFGRDTEDHLVWPCRGEGRSLDPRRRDSTPATNRFETRGEVVFDRFTGLEWSHHANLADGLVTWREALERVRLHELEGRLPGPGWRLPTINELDSLVELAAHDPALSPDHPFTEVGDAYWSSTSSAFEPDWCMALYFDAGRVGVGQKKGRWFSVWAVRDGR